MRPRDAVWFLTGAFVTFAIGGLVVRAVFNCSIDGSTFWTGVGSLSVMAAALVATVNLAAFMDTERIKLTLSFLERFNRDQIDKSCGLITSGARSNRLTIRDLNLKIYSEEFIAAEQVDDIDRATCAARSYAAIQQQYIQVNNYFTEALTLLNRRRLDASLFFAILGQSIVDVDYAGGLVFQRVGSDLGFDLSALNRLAQQAGRMKPPIEVTKALTIEGDTEA